MIEDDKSGNIGYLCENVDVVLLMSILMYLIGRMMLASTNGNIGPALRVRRKWVYNVPRRTGQDWPRLAKTGQDWPSGHF